MFLALLHFQNSSSLGAKKATDRLYLNLTISPPTATEASLWGGKLTYRIALNIWLKEVEFSREFTSWMRIQFGNFQQENSF